MYLWCLLPSATSAPPVDQGTSPDLATAMRVTESRLTSPHVFMLAIRELALRISVDGLVPGWVPTGREWYARRAMDDTARWVTKRVPVDPDLVYFIQPPAEAAEWPEDEREDEPAEDSRDVGSPAPHPDAPRWDACD